MRFLFLFAIMFFACSFLDAANLLSFKGSVSVKKAGTDAWINATKKMRLDIMDEIKTGDKSSADIELIKGYRLNLGSNTVMAIRDQGVLKEKGVFPSVMLYMGEIFSSIKKIVVGKVELHTPNSVIGVRGTEFYSRVLPNGASSLDVRDGIVDFNSLKENSKVVSVNQGEMAVVDFDLSVKVFKNKKEWDVFLKDAEDRYSKNPELKLIMFDSVLDNMLKEITSMNDELVSRQKEIDLLNEKKKNAVTVGDTNTAIQFNDQIYSKSFDLHNTQRRMKHIQLRARAIKYIIEGANPKPATIDKILRIESMVAKGER